MAHFPSLYTGSMASSSRPLDPRRLDVAALAAAGAELAGEWPLHGFARLASATLPATAGSVVAWKVRGERATLAGGGMRPALAIDAAAEVTLECQRCLQPMQLPISLARRIFFVDGEEAAAALDLDSDDDVLALPPALDLHQLLEDELLLALPVVPRHDACSVLLTPATGDDDLAGAAREHPFAALAALKRGPRLN